MFVCLFPPKYENGIWSACIPGCDWCAFGCKKVAQVPGTGDFMYIYCCDWNHLKYSIVSDIHFLSIQVRKELGIGENVKVVILNFGGQVIILLATCFLHKCLFNIQFIHGVNLTCFLYINKALSICIAFSCFDSSCS